MKITYEYDGRERECWIDLFGERQGGRAGWAIGLLAFRGDFADAQDLPSDAYQYSFTHGGDEYRAAVRAAWAAIEARRTVVIEAPPGHVVV